MCSSMSIVLVPLAHLGTVTVKPGVPNLHPARLTGTSTLLVPLGGWAGVGLLSGFG